MARGLELFKMIFKILTNPKHSLILQLKEVEINLINKTILSSALNEVSILFIDADLFKLFSSIEGLQPQL